MKKAAVAVLWLICLVTCSAFAQDAEKPGKQVETGVINGAPFRIEIPAEWNKVLIMYCHGYLPAAVKPDLNDLRVKLLTNAFVSRGFAFAQSAYSVQGWAVKEAMDETEALRRHFISKYGKPGETYIMGHSMGAVVSLATIEKYGEAYDGAMPMCGPLDTILTGLQERVFDMLVTFDFLFQGVIGPPVDLPPGARLDAAKVKAALDADPEKATIFARHYSLASNKDILSALTFFYELNRELQQRAGGNPFDNRNTIYDGFDDDVALNRGVKRYAASAKARDYLREYYTPTGRISHPVLTIHTTHDPLVPGRYVSRYDSFVKLAGTQDLFVTKFVAASGHCKFTLPQTTAAFDELLKWVRERKRPEPGEVK